MSNPTLKERVAVIETKIEQLSVDIKNHTGIHFLDRIIQAVNLLGMVLIIYLLKIVLLK